MFDSLQTHWRTAYPAAFDQPWVELRGGTHPLDSGAATGSALCIGAPAQITGNAYYCPDSDGIVYDTGVLVPVLLDHYGEAGLKASFAHEFGHAVAARIGIAAGPAVFRELQADCFAGTVLTDPSYLPPTELLAALAPLLDFADQPATEPDDATAHGLAADRAQALLLGFRHGPVACRDIGADTITVALGRFTPTVAERVQLAATAEAAWAAAPDGCALGRNTAAVDPDPALNWLRTRPDATAQQVIDYLDGVAGRC